MATADEYAQWIVENKHLKGSPQFETVAKAYSEASLEEGRSAPDQSAQPRTWPGVAVDAVKNLPGSAANFASGLYQAVRHPFDTAEGLWDAAAGGLRNTLPTSFVNAVEGGKPSPGAIRASDTANSIKQFYKDRYSSMEGLKNTLATDPVGAASDLSTLLTGGAMLSSRAPALSSALQRGANLTNPLSAVAPAAKLAGTAGKHVLGLTTGAGAEAVEQAAKSGYGGKSAFWNNMTGNAPMTDVLDDARSAVQEMGRQKSAAYKQGMADITSDKSILDFGGIDRAVKSAEGMAKYKGQVKNARAAQIVDEISEEVRKWKALDASDYHTPEGLDALKQKVGGLRDSLPYEEKTARAAANSIYGAIKDEIATNAKSYTAAMKGYHDASDLISEIERALSLKETASADTAMRKLQSLMRNNANTNYGNRLGLAKTLEEQGGKEMMPALAGQAMNSWVGRGLIGQGGNLGTIGAALAMQNPAVALALPLQSPRAVGATLYGGGRLSGLLGGGLDRMGVTPQNALTAGLLAEQAGRSTSR